MEEAHILVVAVGTNGQRSYTMRCPGVTDHCCGWLECREPGCTAYEESDDEAHGVEHRYIEEVGYSVPIDECWLVGHSDLPEMARYGVGDELQAGDYPVRVIYTELGPELRLEGGV